MDINTLYTGFLVGFVYVTALAVICMAFAGLLVAIYAAVPATRTLLENLVLSEEERSRSKAMAKVDRTMNRQLKDLRRSNRRMIYQQL